MQTRPKMRFVGQICGSADMQPLPRADATRCNGGDLPLTVLIPTLRALKNSLRVAPRKAFATVEGDQQQQQQQQLLEDLCNLLGAHSNGSAATLVDCCGTSLERHPQEAENLQDLLAVKDAELDQLREEHEQAQQKSAAHVQQACGAADDALRMFNEERAKHQLTSEQLSAAREELQAAAHVQVEHRRLETQVNTAEVAQQRMQAELSALQAETTRLAAENKVLKAKTKADVARETEAARVERERSALQSQVARLQAENSGLRAKTERMAAQERELVRIAAGVDLRRQEQQVSFQGMEESSATSRQEDIVVELAATREALSSRETLAIEQEAAFKARLQELEDLLNRQAQELHEKAARAAAMEAELNSELQELRAELSHRDKLEAQSTLVTPSLSRDLSGEAKLLTGSSEECPGPLWKMSHLITDKVRQAAVTAAESAIHKVQLEGNIADHGYLRKMSQLAGDAAAGHAARHATGSAIRTNSEPPPTGPAASAASAAAAAAVAEAAAVAAVRSMQAKPQAHFLAPAAPPGATAAPSPLLSGSSTTSSRKCGCSLEVPAAMLNGPIQNGAQVKSSARSSKAKKLLCTSASTSATASPQVGTGYSTSGAPGLQKIRRGNNVGNERNGMATPPAGMFTTSKVPSTLQNAGGSGGNLQVARREETLSIAPTASSTTSPGPITRDPSPRQGARTPGVTSSFPGSPGMSRFTPRELSPGTTTQAASPPLPQQVQTRVPSPKPLQRGAPSGRMSPRANSPTGVPPLSLTTVASRGRLGVNSATAPLTASNAALAALPSGAAPGALPRLARIALGSSSSGPLVHRMVSPRGPTAAVGSPMPATSSHAPSVGTASPGGPSPRGNTHGANSPLPGGCSAPAAGAAFAANSVISPLVASSSYTPVVSETAGPILHSQLSQSPRRFASPTQSSPREGSLATGSPPSLSVRAYSSGALLTRGSPPEAAPPSKE